MTPTWRISAGNIFFPPPLDGSMRVFDREIAPDRHRKVLPSLKIIIGLILLVAIFSQSPLDPGPMNLLRPTGGIGNWFGMPGALAAGFLLELLGVCGFLVPLSLIVLKHDDRLSIWQIVLLDVAMLFILTTGLAQLQGLSDDSGTRLTGLLGELAVLHLHAFPGKLITLLLTIGFVARYRENYRYNPQSWVMLKHVTAVLLLLYAAVESIIRRQLGVVGSRIGERISPFSAASQEKMAAARDRSVGRWRVLSTRFMEWILEVNPFYRFYDEKAAGPDKTLLDDKGLQELEGRKLLSDTIAHFERRASIESR